MHHYPDLISASDWLKQISHAVQPCLGPHEMKAFFSQARFFFVNILFSFMLCIYGVSSLLCGLKFLINIIHIIIYMFYSSLGAGQFIVLNCR